MGRISRNTSFLSPYQIIYAPNSSAGVPNVIGYGRFHEGVKSSFYKCGNAEKMPSRWLPLARLETFRCRQFEHVTPNGCRRKSCLPRLLRNPPIDGLVQRMVRIVARSSHNPTLFVRVLPRFRSWLHLRGGDVFLFMGSEPQFHEIQATPSYPQGQGPIQAQ
uniref:Uncharacterized protein n=1 Tax=Candidatus Kentrum sp. LFY TaxID=2126342 RepID=A0A450UH44_9GAMM|nr:MAG: hypothetical protein BECKLFY1418B_GA0070995_102912 [Candidatus Kentron sp. LFY]